MFFTDPIFIILFLPLAIGVYYFADEKWRKFILIITSFIFYACGRIKFLPYILIATLANTFFAFFFFLNSPNFEF